MQCANKRKKDALKMRRYRLLMHAQPCQCEQSWSFIGKTNSFYNDRRTIAYFSCLLSNQLNRPATIMRPNMTHVPCKNLCSFLNFFCPFEARLHDFRNRIESNRIDPDESVRLVLTDAAPQNEAKNELLLIICVFLMPRLKAKYLFCCCYALCSCACEVCKAILQCVSKTTTMRNE